MSYAGRHRQVAPQRRRTRRSRAAAVMAGALIAPLMFNPTPAQAAVTTAKFDSLANHPEWRLSANDPAVASRIASLKATLTQRGVAYDPAAVGAYRVPTVEGFTTYVTASPQTMTVRPNPQLLARTPEGTTPVDPAVVLTRLIAPEAEGSGGVGLPALPSATIFYRVYNDAWYELSRYGIDQSDVDALLTTLSTLVRDAVEGDARAAMDQAKAQLTSGLLLVEQTAAEKLQQVVDIVYSLPIKDVIIDRVLEAVGPAVQTVDALNQFVIDYISALDVLAELDKALDQVPVEEEKVVAFAQAALDKLKQESLPTDPYAALERIEDAVARNLDPLLRSSGLPSSRDLHLAGMIIEVVPLVAAAPSDPYDDIMVNPNVPGARDDDGENATWSHRNSDCFRIVSEWFDRRVCWRIDGQSRDSNPENNYWQLHTDVSGHSIGRNMSRLWVEARPTPHGASNQNFDAMPVPNADFGGSEGCETRATEFSIASGAPVQFGLAWTWERTTCEKYAPKTYDDDGHWASIWSGNNVVDDHVQRYVMLKVPVRTPYTKGVGWELLTGQHTTYSK